MAGTNPRYASATELLQLVIALQGTSIGLTLDAICERFGVTRKTAERRLNAVRELFPNAIESQTLGDRRKYWRLRGGLAAGLVRVDPVELTALDAALERVEREGRPDQAQALRSLSEKVRALGEPARLPGLETDAEALLEGEGLAMRPGPRPKIPIEVVSVLREALLAQRVVRLEYRSRIKQEESSRTVHPYGFLFGGRHYLIAHDAQAADVRMFSLSNILGAELLAASFERPDDFDLGAYAIRSFGVYQDEPRNVVWRFRPQAAANASEYEFHPTQRVEREPDGSLLVRFRAGGLWEMAWHLFQWRGDVEIVEPEELRETLREMLRDALRVHGDR